MRPTGHGPRQATAPVPLRRREVLDAQLARCRQVDNSFTRGAVAALDWLITGGPGPLTGALTTAVGFPAINSELAVAEAIVYGPPGTGRDYAHGVEHALMWARRTTARPPVTAAHVNASGKAGMETTSASGEAPGERWAASMANVHQAAGMLTVQLGVTITEAFARLHDYATDADRPVDDVARDIIHCRLLLSAADRM